MKSNIGSGVAWVAVVLLIGFALAAKQPVRPLVSVPPPPPIR